MKKRTGILWLLLIASLAGYMQPDSVPALVLKIPGTFRDFAVDHLDNIYLLTATDQLKKLDAKGDSLAVFNNLRQYGKVSRMNVTNPLRVLLYYKDFSTVLILDRLLNIRSVIDLRRQNIFQVQAIGGSYDNKLWLYDELDHKLKKVDEDGKLLFETSDFRQLFKEAFSFTTLIDQDGLLYLYDTQKGVLVFDYYGSFKKRIFFTGVGNFQVSGKFLTGIKNDSLLRYQPEILATDNVVLPQAVHNSIAVAISGGKIYALKKEALEVYQIK